jgi:K(+)-stimulated pyrophosphate-energized sodium pump
VIAPILGGHTSEEGLTSTDVNIEMSIDSEDIAQATITYTTNENGVEVTKEERFEGTQAEVEEQLEAFEKTTTNAEGEVEKVITKMDVTKQ